MNLINQIWYARKNYKRTTELEKKIKKVEDSYSSLVQKLLKKSFEQQKKYDALKMENESLKKKIHSIIEHGGGTHEILKIVSK